MIEKSEKQRDCECTESLLNNESYFWWKIKLTC